MAGVENRVYMADSKITVRRKLGLDKEQDDEEFDKFEVDSICSRIYRYSFKPDPKIKWSNLDRSAIMTAKSIIADECRKDKLRLGDSAEILSELIEWKIFQSHRAAQKKVDRRGKDIGNDAESSNNGNRSSISNSNSGPSKEPLDQSESQYKGQQGQ